MSRLLGKAGSRGYTNAGRGRGGTGRRAGLKIRFRKECRFDSDRPHQLISSFDGGCIARKIGRLQIQAEFLDRAPNTRQPNSRQGGSPADT